MSEQRVQLNGVDADFKRQYDRYSQDYLWVRDNHNRLVENFASHWIGVQDTAVIADSPDLDDLMCQLRGAGHDPSGVVVEFISRDAIPMVV